MKKQLMQRKNNKVLGRKFFERPTLEVAQNLLGTFLVRKIKGKELRAKIVDVEAYIGEDDLACHASKGKTPRTEIMYGAAGHIYVYLIYGMHFIMNIITEGKNMPATVMIRAVEIEGIDRQKTNGPGKVCRVLQIDKSFHGHDATKKEKLWIEQGEQNYLAKEIAKLPRVGIAYAQHCAHYPWRFAIKSNKQ